MIKAMVEAITHDQWTYRRQKDLNFANVYGAGVKKLALMLGFITQEQFEELNRNEGEETITLGSKKRTRSAHLQQRASRSRLRSSGERRISRWSTAAIIASRRRTESSITTTSYTEMFRRIEVRARRFSGAGLASRTTTARIRRSTPSIKARRPTS
jgi:hypothetical protein